MCVAIPLSVNECNLREVYTIAPREVRQMGNDDVRSGNDDVREET
jgi:hypothetical protein